MPQEGVNDFRGIAKDIAKTKLPQGFFQEDQGGSRFKRGSWKRRKGMRRTDVPAHSQAITSLLGFEMPGTDFALVLVTGTEIHGYTNVAQQGDASSSSGSFGDGSFGELGFGDTA